MSPQEDTIKILAGLLEEKRKNERREEQNKKYEKVKDVLLFIAFFGTCVFAPKTTEIFRPLIKHNDYYSWKKFNLGYLKWNLARLAKAKIIEVDGDKEEKTITITDKGKRKILKYALEDLEVPQTKKWDGKWRIVLYDINAKKRRTAQLIRENLLRLGFIQWQESVYLFPYYCVKQIELLRNYYQLDKEIKLVTACSIEDEEPYKEYFGLNK